jgi:anti-sigma B factor antagonist
MKTATREQSGATIVDISGDIDMGTSPGLRKTLLESLKQTPRLVVNLREVRYIDSSGIASLVEVLKEARIKEKRLVLFGLNTAVREVLQLTRLAKIFEIRETEEQALTAGGDDMKTDVVCAGINRQEAEGENPLRERSSDPLGPEFCAGRREARSET